MRLGEALSLRALQAQKLNDLRVRIVANAVTQEGQEPQESSQELIEQYRRLSQEHALLVLRIARTNVASQLDIELQEREHLRRFRNTLEQVTRTVETNQAGSRYMRSELRVVGHLNAAQLHDGIDEVIERLRELDAAIQQRNWETELAE